MLIHEPLSEILTGSKLLADVVTQPRNRARKFSCSRWGFTEPERNPRRLAVGILDTDRTRDNLKDFPRRIAELKNISGHAFDGEIFVDRADESLAGLQYHAV